MQIHQRLVIIIPASVSVVPLTISFGGVSITRPIVVHHPERRIVVESVIGVDQGVDERQGEYFPSPVRALPMGEVRLLPRSFP